MLAVKTQSTHTLDNCKKVALTYPNRAKWQEGDRNTYMAAYRNKWLEECCAHMELLNVPKWTLAKCQAAALGFKSRVAWQEKDRNSYMAAYRNKWLEKCCSHMVRPNK